MQEELKQKQESIALQNSFLSHQQHKKLEINLFMPINDIISQKLQTPKTEMTIPKIKQESCKTSRLNQENQHQNIIKKEKKQRKHSQKSQHYHRVHNSRKIKTKKVQKNHLERSEYFYYDNPNQNGDESKVMNLLNKYEEFHQNIFDSLFEKKVIKLSHHKSKGTIKKKSTPQIFQFNKKVITDHNSCSLSFKQSYFGLSRNLSKSLVIRHPSVTYSRFQVLEDKNDGINKIQEHEIKKSRMDQKMNADINKKLEPKINLSKHATPIRTIFLNNTRKDTSNLNYANQFSPTNKVSSFTPLGSQRINKKPSLKPFKSILQNPIFNNSHKLHKIKNDQDQSLQTKTLSRQSPTQNKLGISIVSRKYYQIKTQSNYEDTDVLAYGKSRNCKIFDEMILAQQIMLPQKTHHQKYLQKQKDLKKFSFTLTSNQGHSRCHSKKGLSLTQSAKSLNTKKQLMKISTRSNTKTVHIRQEKKENILDKKLSFTYLNPPKRVEIRIF